MEYTFDQLLTPGTLTVIGLVLMWLVRSLAKKFLSKGEIETLMAISAIAVEAAEQLAKIGKLEPEKRNRMALDLVIKELNNRGIHLSLELIASSIEAAVLLVNNSKIPTFDDDDDELGTIEAEGGVTIDRTN